MKNLITKISVLGFAMLSLSFSTNAQWTRNAGTLQTYLTNTGDNVGIGTTNPTFKLDVRSTGIATMNFKSTNDNASLLLDRGNSTNTASLTYRTAGINNWQTGCVSNNNFTIRNNNLAQLTLHCDYLTNFVGIGTNVPANKLSVAGNADFSGNVGIGTSAPSRKLHVSHGASGATPMTNAGIVLEGSSQTFLNLLVPTGFETGVGFGNPTNSADAGIYYNGVGTGKLDLRTGGNVSRMTIDGTGKVGIGTTIPGAELDVIGTSRALQYSTADYKYGILGSLEATNPGISSAGVFGYVASTGPNGRGVFGHHSGSGLGVAGYSVSGKAIYGNSNTGYAGWFDNKVTIAGHGSDEVLNISSDLGYQTNLRFQKYGTNLWAFTIPSTNNDFVLWNFLNATSSMHFNQATNYIGIGTDNPAYKLDVCGTMRAKEVRVETGWCDYVFKEDYKLRSLKEVEEFIKVNKHLPDVTPGPQIESEGLEVGKTSAQMIKKIEELTLYVIDMNKNLEVKEKQISDLQKQVDELKSNK